MNQRINGSQERHEAGAEAAEKLTGQDGHFHDPYLEVAEQLMAITSRIELMIGGEPEPPHPSDEDLAALRKIRDVFSRLTLAQQLYWLRRYVLRAHYLEAIRIETTHQPQRIEA